MKMVVEKLDEIVDEMLGQKGDEILA